ncbi:MerR family transcriptional regulator [Phenylobacterium sp. 58.2.17]|uniref:MerR family transcriptional regulator n=1 Tax=Phenylobacterium sp. 58.2.17 TaxID=2969306 RepID=UPI002264900C|nr:helix-turn-helix domain-containing protein [Phenylobacterium sp. 58.2.17]MCX7587808.1 helix-turn-helix domain-containing protein [Phenylobacterium sp. 58.2.17]
MTARRALTIGRLAAEAGVHLETIRYYERVGVMPEPDRTPGGHRHYTAAHRQRLAFIRRARELGFSLDDIRTLIALDGPGRGTCAEVEPIAAAHLITVRAKIADLVRLEAVLDDAVRRCAGGTSPSCPVIEVLGSA